MFRPASKSPGPLHTRHRRRAVLSAGSLGLLSGSFPSLANGSESDSSTSQIAGFGRAKRVLMLFMWGGPSQLDTLDPSPTRHARFVVSSESSRRQRQA